MITAAVESFADVWPEMQPLLPLHHAELALFQDKMPLDVDVRRYFAWDNDGALLTVILRESGALIGYFVGIVGTSPHYQSTLMCKMDVVFLVKEHRGQKAGSLLLDTVKAELKRRGVKLWWMGSKVHLPIAPLLEAHGFELAETYHTQWIGD